MSGCAALLRALVDGDALAVARALHPRAVLERADGTVVSGRQAVIAALAAPERGVRREVVAIDGDSVVVAIEIEGVPTRLRCVLRGELRAARLVRVRVEV